MARLLTDGAEMADTLGFPNSTLDSSVKRSGAYSYRLNSTTTVLPLPSSASELYSRTGFLSGDNYRQHRPFEWYSASATSMGYVVLRQNGSYYCFDAYVNGSLVASGTSLLSANVWNLVEVHIKIADSGGIIQTKINGIMDIDYSGDTKPSTATNITHVAYTASINNYYAWFDDLAINDTTGTADNSWCGDGHIIALVPNANGDLSQLSGSDGNSTDNYLLVDETPSNNDTDYVEGSTVDEKDLYNLTASGLSNANIARVWGESRSKDTTSAGGLLAITIKTESTEYDSADISLSTNYTIVKGTEYLLNPQTGVAWTIAELDALQVGPKTRS